MTQARKTMHRVGMQLIEGKRRAMTAGIDHDKTKARDLLTVLSSLPLHPLSYRRHQLNHTVRSNLSSTPSQQMSVSEVLGQISTFITAGHETTSSALTWCLYALARDSDRQDRLRRALRALTETENRDRGWPGTAGVGVGLRHQGDGVQVQVPGRGQEWDDEIKEEAEEERQVAHEALLERICECEYLDWVVREVLRVHAPITSTMRICMHERDEIPVGKDGYVDKHGKRRWSIPVKKWDIVTVPIQAINKSTELWGEDASEFRCVSFRTSISHLIPRRPERWAKPPESVRAIPGLFASTLTFLNGNPINGNRACIGFKFALFE
jgi:hypothetical protein